MDVVSLYTNISFLVALAAIRHLLNEHRKDTECPKNESLLQLLDFVMNMNNFQFNGKDYLQVGGTAMGARVAPSLANYVMGEFEEKFVYTYHTQRIIWIRFLDDCFGIWLDGEESLLEFKDYLNSVDDNIKFTMEYSREKVAFLDTMVHLNKEGDVWTEVYTKPTDTHSYLHYSLAHPFHMKKEFALQPVPQGEKNLHI